MKLRIAPNPLPAAVERRGGPCEMSPINGIRQGRSTTVYRGRLRMWTRLGTHHTPRGAGGGGCAQGEGGRRGYAGRIREQRVHNGYVRQGWILLINPTGYIVPPVADIPRFPPLRSRRRRSSWPCRCASPPGRSSTSYSPLLHRHERYPFVGMSCVAGYRAASVRRYYITLIMRACAKGGTGPRRPARPVPSAWIRTTARRRRGSETPLRGTTVRRLPRSRSLAGGGRCPIKGDSQLR